MTTQLHPEGENFETTIRKEGAGSGLALGIIVTVISIISLYILVSISSFWLLMGGPFLLNILLPLVIAIFFTISLRKKIGGYWSFKQALTGIFVMFLVSLLISTVISVAFQRFVEPDIQERMIRNISNSTIVFMENQGVPDEQIDAATAQFDEQLEALNNAGIGQQVKGFFIGVIVIFVAALIFAAIFKRERPVFIPADEE